MKNTIHILSGLATLCISVCSSLSASAAPVVNRMFKFFLRRRCIVLKKKTLFSTGAWATPLFLLIFLVRSAVGAPVIESASGTFIHKGTLTITGAGFGNKDKAAPLVWDDASTGSIPSDNGKWTDAWPTKSDSPTFYTRYTTPVRGIPLPHNNDTRYITGGHGDEGWTLTVDLHKNYQINAYPQPVFISYYYRIDNAWNFCSGDNNFKLGSHSMPSGPYYEPYWYYEHRDPDLTSSSTPGIFTPYIPNGSGNNHNYLNGTAVNPKGNWVKIEYEASYTNQSSGYVKIWNNGKLGTQYNGKTDAGSPGTRTDAIGGYARCSGSKDNWRYFADVYLDTSLSRVMLGNAPTFAASTIREMQIPSAWSSTSITATANLGKLTQGQTAYLYVFDSSGVPNSTGYSITVSSSSAEPAPPNNLEVR
jgi:hypothetical protein